MNGWIKGYCEQFGPLAQLAEQETLNLKVDGSKPSRPIVSRTSEGFKESRIAGALQEALSKAPVRSILTVRKECMAQDRRVSAMMIRADGGTARPPGPPL